MKVALNQQECNDTVVSTKLHYICFMISYCEIAALSYHTQVDKIGHVTVKTQTRGNKVRSLNQKHYKLDTSNPALQ